MQMITSFQVAQHDLPTFRWETGVPSNGTLTAGEILVAISRFAYTSNNVIYARLGDQIRDGTAFVQAANLWDNAKGAFVIAAF